MNNISLMKISLIVVAATLASCFVSADDDIKKDINKLKQEVKQSINKLNTEIDKQPSFSDLIAKLDRNNNGQLSKSEITLTNNELLEKAFNKIDLNADAEITQKEFETFLNQVNFAINSSS